MKRIVGAALAALAVLCCLMALRDAPRGARDHYAASGRSGAYETPAPPQGGVRINTADASELARLPGVGESLAQAIIAEREAHGPFHFPEDVMAVRGIGESKLSGLRDQLDMSEGE